MRVRPNHTVRVIVNLGEVSPDDATGAKAGDTLVIFSNTPEALARGKHYRFEASVLGGPGGERVVAGKADEIKS